VKPGGWVPQGTVHRTSSKDETRMVMGMWIPTKSLKDKQPLLNTNACQSLDDASSVVGLGTGDMGVCGLLMTRYLTVKLVEATQAYDPALYRRLRAIKRIGLKDLFRISENFLGTAIGTARAIVLAGGDMQLKITWARTWLQLVALVHANDPTLGSGYRREVRRLDTEPSDHQSKLWSLLNKGYCWMTPFMMVLVARGIWAEMTYGDWSINYNIISGLPKIHFTMILFHKVSPGGKSVKVKVKVPMFNTRCRKVQEVISNVGVMDATHNAASVKLSNNHCNGKHITL
jgi:hypothetical protein